MTHASNKFEKEKHIRYCKLFLNVLPGDTSGVDSTRLTVAFYAISGLEILDGLDTLTDREKTRVRNWIYRLQILPMNGYCDNCGFQGSDTFEMIREDGLEVHCNSHYAQGHLAITYCALISLLTLGDDLSGVNRTAVLAGVRALQQPDGSFSAMLLGSEFDMRFVYCACCICYILQDWSGMDVDKTIDFIRKSFSYDYGFGQNPGLESHGGVTYCAVASLVLLEKLDSVLSKREIEGLKRWAVMRQVSGFQGRANKPEDTCYSFWIGATLKMLEFYDKVNFTANRNFILATQDSITGGLAKWEQNIPDPLHTYLGLCGLSFMNEQGLQQIHPALNTSMRAVSHLKRLHELWSLERQLEEKGRI